MLEGKVPHSHEILYNIQTMVALLPNLAVDSLVKSLFVETNDSHLVRLGGFLCLHLSMCVCLGSDCCLERCIARQRMLC